MTRRSGRRLQRRISACSSSRISAGDAEVAPQRLAEHAHLPAAACRRLPSRRWCTGIPRRSPLVAPDEAAAVAVHLARRAIAVGDRQRPVEHLLARRPAASPRGNRGPCAESESQCPLRQHDFGIQAAAGPIEAAVGRRRTAGSASHRGRSRCRRRRRAHRLSGGRAGLGRRRRRTRGPARIRPAQGTRPGPGWPPATGAICSERGAPAQQRLALSGHVAAVPT